MAKPSVELRIKEAVARSAAGNMAIMVVMAKAIKDKYGEQGLSAIREAIMRDISPMFAYVGKQAGARVGDGDATDWVKIERATSGGIEQVEIPESTPTRARMKITECPRARQVSRIWPNFCSEVWIAIERACAYAANPKLYVYPYEKTLPAGDDCCELVCELRE